MHLLSTASGIVPASLTTAARPTYSTPELRTVASQGSATLPSRDAALAELADTGSSVNLLAQASSAATGSGDAALLALPPLPPMPAPQPAPAVPTDDHGHSNIVFSDPDDDGTLIH